jgi:acetyltransferase
MQMVRYHRSQAMLMEVPPDVPEAFAPDRTAARDIIAAALADGHDWLLEADAKRILAAYGIPVVPTWTADTPAAAAGIAADLEGPVALKVLSPAFLHKSDGGGVALNLETPGAVHDQAVWMQERFGSTESAVPIRFSVQPMVQRPNAHELIVGMHVDPQFGPVLLFGHGGTATDVIKDRSLGLPPLNMTLAREMITGTRIHRLLVGYRGIPAADLTAIAATLVKASQLVCDLGEIVEMDINPLVCDARGVIALDARMRLQPTADPPSRRLAICPYPSDLEQQLELPGGQYLQLRPIRPEDEPAFRRLFDRLPPDDVRLRFLHPMKMLPRALAARLTQIDYDREMALVLTGAGGGSNAELYGVGRFSADPDNGRAEFAILLDPAKTGLGLGPMLMRRIIDVARERGIGQLFGEVLSENRAMLALCRAMGFKRRSVPDDPGVSEVTLVL